MDPELYFGRLNNFVNNNTFYGEKIYLPYDWSFDGVDNKLFKYKISAGFHLNFLMEAYLKGKGEQYKQIAIDWTLDWLNNHDSIDLTDNSTWHDDATGRRVYYFSKVYQLFEEDLSESERALFKENLHMQAELLTDPEFYKEKHNHGVYQDIGLAASSIVFDFPEKEEWLYLAMERTREYYDYALSSEGVLKEHSPEYHRAVTAVNMAWFAEVYETIDPEFSQYMSECAEKACQYYVDISLPNKTIPNIGDDTKLTFKETSTWMDNENYKYVYSDKKEGKKPESTFAIYPDAGYGVMRSAWEDEADEATYMLLTAATHSEAHKHNDDLNFLLYHKGELIVEAGGRNYYYSEPLTIYAYSSYGHNVLFVNGEGWKHKPTGSPLLERAAYNTKITHWYNCEEAGEGEWSWISAEQTRFDNVKQTRTLSYNKAENIVIIEDELQALERLDARLIYHISSDVEVSETENGWKFFRNGVEIAEGIVTGSSNVSITTYYGDEDEQWKSYVFNGNSEPDVGTLLAVDTSCVEGG